MPKSLSIYELKELYDSERPSKISFDTDEQLWHNDFDSLRLSLVFSNIVIVRNPALIYLTDGQSQLCLNQIKRIERKILGGDSGEVLTVVSLDRYGRDISYEFLVS